MPKITEKTRKNDNLNKLNPISIVLWKRSNNKESLFWQGIIKKNENTNEEPLILKFADNNYYFYKSEINQDVIKNIKGYKRRKYWRDFNKLNLDNQKKIIKAYAQKHNQEQNILFQMSVLLHLKTVLIPNIMNNSLNIKNQNYQKEFRTLYNNIFYWYKKIEQQKELKNNNNYHDYLEHTTYLKAQINECNEKIDNLIKKIEKYNLDIELNYHLEKEQNKLLNLEKSTITDREIDNFFFNSNSEISNKKPSPNPDIEKLLKEEPSSNPDTDYIKNFDLEELEF